mmetsp:Transcript_25563/g.73818  ORF Transcript_25563/g.73818 Transcript_25563/m.73818 type:complete len:333 (-) Transcript_25563:566-1564(-)|eukprot:CAMPEP_0168413900 /NCGR_PEP_ID=MMETSP0228-20121227/29453_1 /TAXON_ID=133427 /ORGANISM="Protoceratium reticulatum, Strain CCCM 535 (=CCMP 1889)" /LENGTH=332 /DNA_ID=CAMNT_0008427689 /DNA_START=218 /DNA_END=1216 /DNA_ORIENTATION=+
MEGGQMFGLLPSGRHHLRRLASQNDHLLCCGLPRRRVEVTRRLPHGRHEVLRGRPRYNQAVRGFPPYGQPLCPLPHQGRLGGLCLNLLEEEVGLRDGYLLAQLSTVVRDGDALALQELDDFSILEPSLIRAAPDRYAVTHLQDAFCFGRLCSSLSEISFDVRERDQLGQLPPLILEDDLDATVIGVFRNLHDTCAVPPLLGIAPNFAGVSRCEACGLRGRRLAGRGRREGHREHGPRRGADREAAVGVLAGLQAQVLAERAELRHDGSRWLAALPGHAQLEKPAGRPRVQQDQADLAVDEVVVYERADDVARVLKNCEPSGRCVANSLEVCL